MVGRNREKVLEFIDHAQRQLGTTPARSHADCVADPGREVEAGDLDLALRKISVFKLWQIFAQRQLGVRLQQRPALLDSESLAQVTWVNVGEVFSLEGMTEGLSAARTVDPPNQVIIAWQ